MGFGEAAVLIEVGPEKGQPDQPGRAGEMGAYPSGEFDGFGLPSSRLAYTHPRRSAGWKKIASLGSETLGVMQKE